MTEIIFILFAYLCGSIPFGLLFTKAAGLGDVRSIGSGNIGATNVMRTGKKWLGIATFLADALKGIIPLWLAEFFFQGDAVYLVALAAVLGHIYPVWLGFRGGKGVATSLAVIIYTYDLVGFIAVALWASVFMVTRISALASVVAMVSLPITAYVLTGPFYTVTVTIVAVVVLWRHRENIARMIKGEELGFKQKNNE